jgi:hypothetical protein
MNSISLQLNTPYKLPDTHFKHASNGHPSTSHTHVVLTQLANALQINFLCLNNPMVACNNYIQHNSTIWQQEVFEIFITENTNFPAKYLELEINPNGAVFAGWISNPSGNTPAACEFLDIAKSNLTYYAGQQNDSWWGFIQLPLALFKTECKDFRINIFRIIATQKPEITNWQTTHKLPNTYAGNLL